MTKLMMTEGGPRLICDWCNEPILPEEVYSTIPCIGCEEKFVNYHQECFLRSIAGCVEHQKHMIANPDRPCPGTCIDDPKLTTREAAISAWRHFIEFRKDEIEEGEVIQFRVVQHQISGHELVEIWDNGTFIGAIYGMPGGVRVISKHLDAARIDAGQTISIDHAESPVAIGIQIIPR